MWLRTNNLTAHVTRHDAEELAFLRDYLTFANTKSRFNGGPNRFCLLHPIYNHFPMGFLPLVRKRFAEMGYDLEVADERVKPCEPFAGADLAWLRWYQLEAIERIVSRARGILWCPTGSGKTEIVVGLTRRLPCRWLSLVHRKGLMEDVAARWELRSPGLVAGRVGDGQWSVGENFTSATFATVDRALKDGDKRAIDLLANWAEGIVIDECHTLPAESHLRVCQTARNAYFRVGMSGTPLARGDRKSQYALGALGTIVYRIKPEVLIKEGMLAKPRIVLVECRQRSKAASWQAAYAESVVRSDKRNRLIIKAVEKSDKPCIVFVKEIAHGRILHKLMEQRGISARFVWGGTMETTRRRAQRDAASGRLDVIIASVVFQEGVDLPELRTVINASGGKSIIAALQRIGRGMRPAEGKDEFTVYDVLDIGCGCKEAAKQLGTPGKGLHNGCKWFDQHASARRRAYTSEGHSTFVEQWVDDADDVTRAADRTLSTVATQPGAAALERAQEQMVETLRGAGWEMKSGE